MKEIDYIFNCFKKNYHISTESCFIDNIDSRQTTCTSQVLLQDLQIKCALRRTRCNNVESSVNNVHIYNELITRILMAILKDIQSRKMVYDIKFKRYLFGYIYTFALRCSQIEERGKLITACLMYRIKKGRHDMLHQSLLSQTIWKALINELMMDDFALMVATLDLWLNGS